MPAGVFAVRLQPATRKPRLASAPAAAAPSTPSPITPTATALAGGCACSCPDPLVLWHIVKSLTPVVGEHVQHDVFGHAHGQIGIDYAHDCHNGQIGIGKNINDVRD